ncbi:hypothetical protein EG830_14140, partial [bacterium]|nr:hypothetical protein [bacterium]
MNLQAAAAYARHLLTARSTAGHGVHSPFMFRFITEVIGGRNDTAIMSEVESLRKEMRSDRRVVQVRDLGAGSVVIRGSGRISGQDAEVDGRERTFRQAESMSGGEQVIRQAESMSGGEQVTRQAGSLSG